MKRYIIMAFGGAILLPNASPPPTGIVPPTNIVLYMRKGNVTLKARNGDK